MKILTKISLSALLYLGSFGTIITTAVAEPPQPESPLSAMPSTSIAPNPAPTISMPSEADKKEIKTVESAPVVNNPAPEASENQATPPQEIIRFHDRNERRHHEHKLIDPTVSPVSPPTVTPSNPVVPSQPINTPTASIPFHFGKKTDDGKNADVQHDYQRRFHEEVRQREIRERESRDQEVDVQNRGFKFNVREIGVKAQDLRERQQRDRELRFHEWRNMGERDQEIDYLNWRERQRHRYTWMDDDDRICYYQTHYIKVTRVNRGATICETRNGVRICYHPKRYFIYPVTRVICYQ